MIMKLAVIRVRGVRNVIPQIKKTLELMRLERPNHCVVIEDSPQNLGMLNVVKDYVTFGPINETTLEKLMAKRGQLHTEKTHPAKKTTKIIKEVREDLRAIVKKIFGGEKVLHHANPVFRLTPPSKGYKNIKKPYPFGALGKRDEEAINQLLKRMM